MKCIKPEKQCPYRDEQDNCRWSCEHNVPGDCEDADEAWGCPWVCIYEALEEGNICPFKEELRKKLEEDLR